MRLADPTAKPTFLVRILGGAGAGKSALAAALLNHPIATDEELARLQIDDSSGEAENVDAVVLVVRGPPGAESREEVAKALAAAKTLLVAVHARDVDRAADDSVRDAWERLVPPARIHLTATPKDGAEVGVDLETSRDASWKPRFAGMDAPRTLRLRAASEAPVRNGDRVGGGARDRSRSVPPRCRGVHRRHSGRRHHRPLLSVHRQMDGPRAGRGSRPRLRRRRGGHQRLLDRQELLAAHRRRGRRRRRGRDIHDDRDARHDHDRARARLLARSARSTPARVQEAPRCGRAPSAPRSFANAGKWKDKAFWTDMVRRIIFD